MAFSITSRGGHTNNGYATSNATGAFTPNANTLLLAFIPLGATGASVSSITGHGTWSLISGSTADSGNHTVQMWGCITGGSPSSSAVTINHTSCTSASMVFEVGDADVSSTVANAIVQAVAGAAYNSGGGPYANTVTLSAFGSASNLCLFAMDTYVTTTGEAFTPQGSLVQDIIDTTLNHVRQISSFTGEDTTPQVNSVKSYVPVGYIGMEIKAAGGGGGGRIMSSLAGGGGLAGHGGLAGVNGGLAG